MQEERAGARPAVTRTSRSTGSSRALCAARSSLRCRAISRHGRPRVPGASRASRASASKYGSSAGSSRCCSSRAAWRAAVFNGEWLSRVFVQRAGARRGRHPDSRELEPRDRGVASGFPRRSRSRASNSFAPRARWIPSPTRSRAWRSRPPACAARRRSPRRRSSWASMRPTSTSLRASWPNIESTRVPPRLDARRARARAVAVRADGHPAGVGSVRALEAQARRRRRRARGRCSR